MPGYTTSVDVTIDPNFDKKSIDIGLNGTGNTGYKKRAYYHKYTLSL